MSKVRLNKRLSELSVCSRRSADQFILDGRVKVNGSLVQTLGSQVNITDIIHVDGEKISNDSQEKLWMLNKPRGYVTTARDEKGRRTVFDLIDIKVLHLKTVGRLDIDSEGLLLITNSSRLKEFYENPKNNVPRKYKVRVFGELNQEKMIDLSKGKKIYGVEYKGFEFKILSSGKNNNWLEITLFEGKNREIRRIMEFIGLQVSRLIRTSFGKYKLDDLSLGGIRELSI